MRKLLIEERKRRQLSQRELASAIGTTQNNISRWELGITTPNIFFRTKLCDFFGRRPHDLDLPGNQRTEKNQRNDTDSTPSASNQDLSYRYVPHLRNPFFIGRDHLLQSLHEALSKENGAVALNQSFALNGLGGIGKTQVALEYTYRYMSAYTAIFWIQAETYNSLLTSFILIADEMNLPEKNEQDQRKIVRAVIRWLSEQQRWLLIFDNVEDLSLLQAFLPPSRQGALLLTTRLQALGSFAQQIIMPPLGAEDALTLLLQRAKLLRPGVPTAGLAPFDLLAAQKIVEETGGLPLAIDQAGAYIEETRCSLTDYLQRYYQQRAFLLGRRGANYQDYPASVQSTLSLSFQQVKQRSLIAAEVLQLCAFLAPDDILEEIVIEAFSKHDEKNQEQISNVYLLDEAIAVLGIYSLLSRDSATKTLQIHRLVQAVLQDSQSEDEREKWISRIINILNHMFPGIEQGNWKQCEQLLPHILRYSEYVPSSSEVCCELGSLLIKVGRYLTERGHYPEAEIQLQRALSLLQSVSEGEHLEIVNGLNALGGLYLEQQKFPQAQDCFEKALAICQQTETKDYSSIATNLNDMGLMHHMQGEYTQAEQFYRQALEIYQQFLPEHLDLAANLNNLAYLFYNQKHYAEAESFFQQALFILEKALQPDHLYIVTTRVNLAMLYMDQENFDEAEAIFQESLAILEQTLGMEHAHIATTFNNFGRLRQKQNRYEEAASLYAKALKIREKVLGRLHPLTLQSLTFLAKLYHKCGQYDQAEALYQQVLPLIKAETSEPVSPQLEEMIKSYMELLVATHREGEARALPELLMGLRS